MNKKIEDLREKMKALGLQGMIVSNPVNVKYLTNINAEGVLLVTRKENIFLTDGRYIEEAQKTLTIDDEIMIREFKEYSQDEYENFFMFCENVGFEEDYVTYSQYKDLMQTYKANNLQETEKIIEKQRMIKDEEEIYNIKRACEITDRCFDYLKDFIKIGKTEKEIAFEIEKYFKTNADGISFDPIVASGINSSKPHAIPTDKKIDVGDVITLDFGCKYKGYCSDMTRTVFAGYIPENIKKIYDLVLKNQELTLRELRDGVNTKTVTKMVENDYKLNNYALVHALGHGVGLDIHEMPTISSTSENILKEKMIVTSEPGIYMPGEYGVRIEDTILIEKNGCTTLTKSGKNYIIVDKQEHKNAENT